MRIASKVPETKKVSENAHLLLTLRMYLRTDESDGRLVDFESPLIRVVDASIP